MIPEKEQLIDLACQISFSNHDRIGAIQDLTGLETIIKKALQNGPDAQTLLDPVLATAVNKIRTHLQYKYQSSWPLWLGKILRLSSILEKEKKLEDFLKNIPIQSEPPLLHEQQARITFFNENAKKLGIRDAAKQDLDAIKICSATFWRYSNKSGVGEGQSNRYQTYAKLMQAYFSGEHFLIADDGDLTNQLKTLKYNAKCISHLRSSSHYDFGSTDHIKGGAVPASEDAAIQENVEPQFEITGPQVKVLLFSKVHLKTNPEANKLQFTKNLQGKVEVIGPKNSKDVPNQTFSWLQTEWAPDSANWLEVDFWRHRVFSFGLYAIRKLLKLEKPNVGPYGYGHGDLNAGGVGPTILSL